MTSVEVESTGLSTAKAPVSVLIPTKDEERNLPSTLAALGWADQVIVFDSFSTDTTVSIATAHGCDVAQRVFDNYADHKNWALANLSFRNAWILILDADEKVSPELAREIRDICDSPAACDAYYVARKIFVSGVWLKYAGKYPDHQLRFFRKGMAVYERRIVHEHMVTTGRVGYLRYPLVHIDDKGTSRYISRHSHFAEMEAVEAFIEMTARRSSLVGAGRTDRSSAARRRRLKTFAYRYLPLRPLLVFFYLYVLKGGFLMGRAGIKTCALRMYYEYMIDLYIEELQDSSSPSFEKYRAYIRERLAHV